jgi:hypothetical protein
LALTLFSGLLAVTLPSPTPVLAHQNSKTSLFLAQIPFMAVRFMIQIHVFPLLRPCWGCIVKFMSALIAVAVQFCACAAGASNTIIRYLIFWTARLGRSAPSGPASQGSAGPSEQPWQLEMTQGRFGTALNVVVRFALCRSLVAMFVFPFSFHSDLTSLNFSWVPACVSPVTCCFPPGPCRN